MWIQLLLASFFIAAVYAACHPPCAWLCDAPNCTTHCTPSCKDANCSYNCPTLSPPNPITDECRQLLPLCTVSCPPNQCEVDACPVCETLCSAAPSFCTTVNCSIQCTAPECGWSCTLPGNCGIPNCRLECEAPACPVSEGQPTRTASWVVILGLLALIAM